MLTLAATAGQSARGDVAGADIWVLLLSDDISRDALAQELRTYAFHVTAASCSMEIEHVLRSVPCDVTILDAGPRARAYQAVLDTIVEVLPGHPVILVGRAAEMVDRVRGLNAGAVDFLAHPVSVPELAARIRARIRFDRLEPGLLRLGQLEVDLPARTVRHRGRPLHLSNLELRLLAYFLRNAGTDRTREEILREVWDEEPRRRSNAVDVYVSYLRRKLENQGCRLPLTTVRGRGYRLEREQVADETSERLP